MAICETQIFGAEPMNIVWKVVRGDNASFTVQFFEPDEVTELDISSWIFEATAFNPKDRIFYDLDVSVNNGLVTVSASSDVTAFWGTGISSKVAELTFDLEVNMGLGNVWTPIIGTISVIGDVTGGRL